MVAVSVVAGLLLKDVDEGVSFRAFDQIGLIGVGLVLAALISTPLLMLAAGQDVPVAMSLPVATGCGLLIFAMAMLASLAAVRTMLKTDPAMLLR